MNTEARSSVLNAAAAEPSKRVHPVLKQMLVLLGLTVAVGFLFSGRRLLVPTGLSTAVPLLGIFSATLLSAYYAAPEWYDQSQKAKWLSLKSVWIVAASAFVTYCIYLVVELVDEIAKVQSRSEWSKGRNEILNDPGLFPEIERLARHYNVAIRLGTIEESWARTTFRGYGGSTASMSVETDLCTLNINGRAAGRWGRPKNHEDVPQWTRGVMVHELAHCVDGSRDYENLKRGVPQVRSIAPADRQAVSDVQTYRVVEERPLTKKWREVYADVFLVGYLRMTAPKAAQERIIDGLREKRMEHRSDDPIHFTACWIDQARVEPNAMALEDLPEWADRIRSEAQCTL